MKKKYILLAAGAIVAGLAAWGFIEGRKELALEQERERPVKVPSRVVVQDGGTAVLFDAATQKRADIAVAPLEETTRRGEVEALATVLPPQELIDLRGAYVAVKTQAEKAHATLQASRREYDRLKALHGDEQNVSAKVLDAAEATWRGDDAVARSADAAMDAAARNARQKWGNVLAFAIVGDAPLFRRLSEQRDVLLRVAAPSGTNMTKGPAATRVSANDGTFKNATLVSASSQADPRMQGAAFFYIAPADGLLPGTTLTAYLATGAEQTGALIPAGAVVWWQGKAWLYVQSAPGHFVRRELPAAIPVEQGWFAPGALKGTQLVVRGAQTLLSEELRSQIQVGEEGK
ncbi:hypothetical protein SAMN05192549_102221 [Duganella sacchari]|uniref:Multidrug efflux pump subunit AcrA (Membrane-fusion protein) n=1 Tax=Duganella sacchari TaxID=551987 RepID=A0A1M7KTB9_9BURK|nr:hypothetical protein [Duganella sacchari]SHM68291.1 hypothetical protein SAMN05192549_102221 [Duganella sacchari]